jgi:hypothetical protein
LIAFFVNQNSGSAALQVKGLQTAAQAVGQEILVLNAGTEGEINQAFATLVQRKVGAILIQHYLGHRSIASTVRYTALAPDRFKGFWKD